MKKLILSLSLVLLITMINAQSVKVQSAASYLRNDRLDKALENIEPATIHEKTLNDPKTWAYRGRIFSKIASTTNPDYQKLDSNAVQKAYDSYQKSIELDTEKEYYQDNMIGLFSCADLFFIKGVDFFNKKDYNTALDLFEKTIKIKSSLGNKDTLAIYNAALSAEFAGNKAKIKEHYLSLSKVNYSNPSIYSTLANVYKEENDTVKAQKIIEIGRKRYPDNYDLIIAEVNFYLYTGNTLKAQNGLNNAIEKDPANPTIHFAVGSNYENMKDLKNAEKSYLKAIELQPDYFDAIYSLGALYVNNAIAISAKANALPLGDKNYDILKKESDEHLNKAIPYLEKASDMKPKDPNDVFAVLSTLKDIYTRLNLPEKLKVVNQKLADFKK